MKIEVKCDWNNRLRVIIKRIDPPVVENRRKPHQLYALLGPWLILLQKILPAQG